MLSPFFFFGPIKMSCPLCGSSNCKFFVNDKRRSYSVCHRCKLVFVDNQHLPSAEFEKAEYDKHQNFDDDPGYLQFLDRARQPILDNIAKGSCGLDYGCGPNPVLAKRLISDGFQMQCFDAIYTQPEIIKPENGFDFIVSTEAIEHFHAPRREWKEWMSLLSESGILVIMTKRWLSAERFAQWHYKNDQTHVSFFHDDTFEYLANTYGFALNFVSNDVVLMQRT